MQETKVTAAEAMEDEEEEEGYVKVGTRFYRVTMRPTGAGGAVARRRLHYLESCYLCKESIACDRDVFMYKGDAAFCSEDCRDEQMDMDEALHAAARRHRLLQRAPASSSSSLAAAEAAASTRPPPVMRRRPTIANLAARNPPGRPWPPASYLHLATGGGHSRLFEHPARAAARTLQCMQLHRWSGRSCLCARVVAGSVGDSFLPPWMSCSRTDDERRHASGRYVETNNQAL